MTKQEHLEKIAEIARCLTNMSLVEVVNYKATHRSMEYNLGGWRPVDDPVMEKYSLAEEQMIPVFKMLKEAVEDYHKFNRESEVAE